MPIVVAEELTKVFASRRASRGAGPLRRIAGARVRTVAVDRISFRVEPGSIVGYIGPNGAGKSTTIKMLTGILVPTEGTVSVCGLEPVKDRRRLAARIGVVFGQRTQLWWDLPLRESFDLLRHVYRVDERRHRENLVRFVELLDLGPLLDVPVRQLSLGQRMRGDLAAALLHDPALVLLDEPTIGLDVIAKDRIRTFIRSLADESGTTVLLTTHDLDDVEQLSDRVIVIDRGRLIFDGDLETLRRSYVGETMLVADLEEPGPPLQVGGARVVRVEGPRQWLRFRRDEVSAATIVAAVAAQSRLRDLSLEEPAIEDVVRHIYGTSVEQRDGGDDQR
ncbi:MAG TPA: ATP-binding cassette domain-containing protein [Actinomycetota bacterium]|nr:ATP-binding cassette domain-containing protein [Actinomycetota bacterium]